MRVRLWAVLLMVLLPAGAWAGDLHETSLAAGRFGTVHLYQQNPHPRRVVLFVSGDGGWNLGVIDMARQLTALDALVVGIDIVVYLKHLEQSGETCLYPAADFEALSKFVQKNLQYPQYAQPVLIGYSSGATLVYALIGQAPPNTFKAAISLGFCPDLSLSRPPCRGNGLIWKHDRRKRFIILDPIDHLQTPWVVLQGEIDQVCNARAARDYVARVPGTRIIMLPKVGHGFSVPANWLPQFKQAFLELEGEAVSASDTGLKDLPLVEVNARPSNRSQLAIMVSGDGGWAGLDRQLADDLADQGLPVVGLDSLKYFWTPRSPAVAAADLGRILKHYLDKWHKDQAVLIGYSLGADVLPFMVTRLPVELRSRVKMVVLLGPGHETAFEFHLSEWIGGGSGADQYPVLPEIFKMGDLATLCFFGEEESDSLCRDRLPSTVVKVALAGGHHFNGDYQAIARRILESISH